jgi:metal-sulfur cluster biosynthetic enzyme
VTANRESVLGVLATLEDPISGSTLVEAGLVKALTVNEGVVRFVMEVSGSHVEAYTALKESAEAQIKALEGVASASIVMTAHSTKKAPPDLKPSRSSEPSGPQNQQCPRILPVRSLQKGAVLVCWMQTYMARRSPVCWASRGGLRHQMARSSYQCETLASR